MTPFDLFVAEVERVTGRKGRRNGKQIRLLCPAHDDQHPSLDVAKGEDGRPLTQCRSRGCSYEQICAAIGHKPGDFQHDGRKGQQAPSATRATVQRSPGKPHSTTDSGVAGSGRGSVAPLQPDQEGSRGGAPGCTLEAYAEAKGLPVEFLRSLHLEDARYAGAQAIRMPYVTADGEEQAVRYRIAIDGDDKFRWKKRSKLSLYGLTRRRSALERGFVVLVEGESCTQTLWLHDFPALGLPGAANWKDERDLPAVEGLQTLYVVIEPDKGGQAILDWLKRSALTTGRRPKPPGADRPTETTLERVTDLLGQTFDSWVETPINETSESAPLPRVKLVSLTGAKDVSELYLQDREAFAARFEEELQRATPYEEHERVAAEIRARQAWKKAGSLAQEPRILDVFEGELDGAGVVGERRLCKLAYLTVNSRFLDRFPSLAVKGPSASGKSWAIERVLDFFPPEAFYLLTAMSERALAYGTEPLSHRFLVLFEAAGLESDFASYLVRSLLSEGCVRYETVEKDKSGQLAARLIERAGPTGMIVSTTSVALHPENETRLLSLAATDTPEQTKLVLSRLANDDLKEPDYSRWHELQIWLATAEHRVSIPYAETLAEHVPPVSVRLRRDFNAVLSLIRSHAILHQALRERDADGKVIATLEDYAIVRELVADLVAEGVEATVSPLVRETVNAVVAADAPEGVSLSDLAKALGIDKSAASRRWARARAHGYLRNLEDGRGKPARIVPADTLPDDVHVLPLAAQLVNAASPAVEPEEPDPCTVDRVAEGTSTCTPLVLDVPRAPLDPHSQPIPISATGDWECPCGRHDPRQPAHTIVALREPSCPHCRGKYRDEYRRWP